MRLHHRDHIPRASLPAHCDLTGVMQERKGVDGQDYAIRFHLRLPDDWNGRFFMQGGGGTNGSVPNTTGRLRQGYAQAANDSGHNNTINNDPLAGGSAQDALRPAWAS